MSKNNVINFLGLLLIGSILLNVSCKKTKDDEAEKKYSGTLTVLQKDAYSDVPGRSSNLWPPHTTTVFTWEGSEKVQLNHGTAPNEVDANGDKFLVVVKEYTFSGTKAQIQSLEDAYISATMDDENKFLDLAAASTSLETSFISGVKEYFADGANGIPNDGDITKDSLISLFEAKMYKEFATHLPSFGWDKADWKIALETVLGDILQKEGKELNNYHVCNDDAELQVGLINNFISTGNVQMPEKIADGPLMFYTPN